MNSILPLGVSYLVGIHYDYLPHFDFGYSKKTKTNGLTCLNSHREYSFFGHIMSYYVTLSHIMCPKSYSHIVNKIC